MPRVSFCALFALAASSSVVAVQGVAVLDLRGRQVPTAAPPSAIGSSSLSDGVATGKSPLQVSLVALDQATYRLGDPLVYSVLVRNTGARAVSFPWEPDWRRVASARPEDVYSCAIALELRDAADTAGAALPPLRLHASKAMPETARRLAPGDAVQIVAPATWRFDASEASRRFVALLPTTTSVGVVLTFEGQPDPAHPWAPARAITNAWVRLTP